MTDMMGLLNTGSGGDKLLEVLAALTQPEKVQAEAMRLKELSDAAEARIEAARVAGEEAKAKTEAAAQKMADADQRMAAAVAAVKRADDRAAEVMAAQKVANDTARANIARANDLADAEGAVKAAKMANEKANAAEAKRLTALSDSLDDRAADMDKRESKLAAAEDSYATRMRVLNAALAQVPAG